MFGWVDPHWWQALALSLGLLALIGWAPINAKTDAETSELWASNIRRLLWAITVFLLGYPVCLRLAVSTPEAVSHFNAWWLSMGRQYGLGVIAAVLLGVGVRIASLRFGGPALSSFLRRHRVAQETETKTDIREEQGKYRTRDFDPRPYLNPEEPFFGFDGRGQPVCIPWKLLREVHLQVMGPTRYGKGVFLSMLMNQGIVKGYGCWYFDPRGDEHNRNLLLIEARRQGRPFYELDFLSGVGSYAPFAGGTAEERSIRVISAFKIDGSGAESDYHKRPERKILRELMSERGGSMSLSELRKEFNKRKIDIFRSDQRRATTDMAIEDGLDEWGYLDGAKDRPHSGSLDVTKALAERAIVYVRCAVKGLSTEVARTLLEEITQVVLRDAPKKRGEHILLVVDEARVMVSTPVIAALATVCGSGVTMALGYQSPSDIRNIEDQRVDKDSAEASINTNCQVKVLHGTTDFELAEKLAKHTGKIRVQTISEQTEVGAFGGEAWTAERSLREDETELISANTFQALQPRVAVVIRPGELARLMWTGFIPYNPADAA
jgi:hypothetical protein